MDRQTFVLGFQFEPEMKETSEVSQVSSEEEEDLPSSEYLRKSFLDGWCKCEKCEVMPTERECVCCQEIDALNHFNLSGKTTFHYVEACNGEGEEQLIL